MRELRYEHRGGSTYLIYVTSEEDSIDSMSLGMLTNNKIDGIVQTQFIQMNDTKQILFNISGKTSAAQLFKGAVNKERLLGILSGVVTAMTSAEEYMLEPQSVLLELDYVFVDTKTSEASLICLPLENISGYNWDLKTFLKDVIYHAQFDQTENCDHVAKILNYLNSTSTISLHSFQSLLVSIAQVGTKVEHHPEHRCEISGGSEISDKPKSDPVDYSYKKSTVLPTVEDVPEEVEEEDDEPGISWLYLMQHYNKENAAAYKAQQEKKKAAKKKKSKPAKECKKAKNNTSKIENDFDLDFDFPGQEFSAHSEDPVVSPYVQSHVPVYEENSKPEHIDYGDTELLVTTKYGYDQQPVANLPYLVRKRTGEHIKVTGQQFLLGRKASDVNYAVDGNNTVGRIHAVICCQNGEYFVKDLNSRNFTYVNGT